MFSSLTGCGVGIVDHSVSPSPTTFQGQVRGGENPISYSLISFYETAGTGVATAISTSGNGIYIPSSPLTALGSTYSNASGNFSFSTPLACSNSNDYVYVTAAGGNPGNNAINPNILLMAAVGSCSSFGASTNVVINELTTVGAAYALSSFISVTGSYTTGSAGNVSFSPQYAGGNTTFTLAQAATVVPGQLVTFSGCAYSNSGTGDPTGVHTVIASTAGTFTIAGQFTKYNDCSLSFATVTASPTVSVTSSATNYLGALSNGSYAPTSSSLAGLAHAFSNAANLVNSVSGQANITSPSNSAAAMPTSLINTLGNVLQGCVNSAGGAASSSATSGCPMLFYNTIISTSTSSGTTVNTPANTLQAAINMAHAPAQNVANILNVAPSVGAFAPAVVSPSDLSMAISYPNFFDPTALTIDYADHIFVADSDPNFGRSVVDAFTSDGGRYFTTAVAAVTTTSIAVDNLGNVFFATGNYASLTELQGATSSSSPTATSLSASIPYAAIAVDKANNLYASTGSTTTGANNLYKYSYGSLGSSPVLIGIGAATEAILQIALDQNGNAWLGVCCNGASPPLIRPQVAAATTSAVEISVSGPNDSYTGMAIDSSGNVWSDAFGGIYKITPTYSSNVITGATAAVEISSTGNTEKPASFDGNNNFITVNENPGTLLFLPTLPNTYVVQSLRPCISGTATACPAYSATNAGIYQPQGAQVDSTGSIWIPSNGNESLVQVIGLAAPAWPLAEQKPAVMP